MRIWGAWVGVWNEWASGSCGAWVGENGGHANGGEDCGVCGARLRCGGIGKDGVGSASAPSSEVSASASALSMFAARLGESAGGDAIVRVGLRGSSSWAWDERGGIWGRGLARWWHPRSPLGEFCWSGVAGACAGAGAGQDSVYFFAC